MITKQWRPSASLELLRQRASLLATVRGFFAARDVLEVETPVLGQYSVTDPYMEAIVAANPQNPGAQYFLQTSPEYAMKRLLAAGSGPIYQLAKAFRQGEKGSRHNPEFTMLEWYRPGFDQWQLMDEIAALLAAASIAGACQRVSYREVFENALGIDPHVSDCEQLKAIACSRLDVQMKSEHRDDWLNLLLAELIEPKLGVSAPVFIYDYPASQAALARVEADDRGVLVARRFELYSQGVELANGYDELTDALEQRRRFEQEQQLRSRMNKPTREADPRLLAAIESGLPACAGVALGFDRLLMLASGASHIDEVLAFPVARA